LTGSVSTVLNYNTGQTSAFLTGGVHAGWNGVASASLSGGFIYGALGSDNRGFSDRFTTVQASTGEGLGGFASFGNGVQVYGASLGVALMPTPTGGIARTYTTQPLGTGPGLGPFTNLLDASLFVARQLCN